MEVSSEPGLGPQNLPLDHATPAFTITGNTYSQEVYQDVLSDEEIDSFLRTADSYDMGPKRWSVSVDAGCLLHQVFNLLQSIVNHFVVSGIPGVERNVLSTETTPGCDGMNGDGYRVCPVLLVRGAGPSFEVTAQQQNTTSSPRHSTAVAFSNIATYFSVRMEEELFNDEDITKEMESYARRVFRAQPNRFFVRSLVLTSGHARMVHFDRSGAQITPPIDIHQDPRTLVRIVAGLSSTNEQLLGLDDSIQWTIANGRKDEGSLTTVGSSGELIKYRILELLTPSDSIIGRGTTCWRVQDLETLEQYVVKDVWRPTSLIPEHELLEVVKGIPGVVQMTSYEAGRGQIRDFRCPNTLRQYHNQTASRTTMKAYGKSIVCFTSPLQLLHALRDAIAAHQRLCGDGLRILHRDISHNNVLLGKEGAPPGERGILIDLDLAFRATDAKPTVRVDYHVGTKLFHSMAVLESAILKDRPPAHDHFDELDSFFFLMTWIFLVFKPDGTHHSDTDEGPSIVWKWASDDPNEAAESGDKVRGATSTTGQCYDLICASWGPACGELFTNFVWWLMKTGDDKVDFDRHSDDEGEVPKITDVLRSFYSHRDEHYAEVLKMFDETIEEVVAEITGVSRPTDDADASKPPNPVAYLLGIHNSAHHVPRPVAHVSPVPAAPRAVSPSPTTGTPALGPSCPLSKPRPSDAPPAVGTSGAKSTLPPFPLAFTTQPRRSARIRDAHLQKSRQWLVAAADTSQSGSPQNRTLAEVAANPRRSTRIEKRRLAEEPDVIRPKSKRAKKGSRRTVLSR